MSMESGVFSAGAETSPNWNLESGYGSRYFSGEKIYFTRQFSRPPTIVVTLSAFDILRTANARLKVSVEDVDPFGFNILVKTWANTKVWSVQVSWLAYDG